MSRLLHVELILGTPILSAEGRPVGRIEEICANERGEISEFHIGERALLERLAAMGLFRRVKKGYRVRWDQIDWSEPRKPRLTCPIDQLARL
jgi:hypothetical protein